jgi:hypothetical protein
MYVTKNIETLFNISIELRDLYDHRCIAFLFTKYSGTNTYETFFAKNFCAGRPFPYINYTVKQFLRAKPVLYTIYISDHLIL